MTTPATHGAAERRPSTFGSVCVWLLRLANTALLAVAVWVLWQQTLELAALNDQLSSLLDYLSVIAERIG